MNGEKITSNAKTTWSKPTHFTNSPRLLAKDNLFSRRIHTRAGTLFAFIGEVVFSTQMKILHRLNSTSALRAGSCVVLASLIVPLTGCGSPTPPPTMAPSQPAMNRPAMGQNPGLSTKQKLVLVAGAAALYYYYRKSKKANEAKYQGQQVQYYLSKNGGIYWREPGNPKNVHWVTAPKTAQVPDAEAQQYGVNQVQGYNGQTTGNGLDYYFNGPGGAAGAGN